MTVPTTEKPVSTEDNNIEDLLDAARKEIAVSDEELDEARDRRDDAADALRREFQGGRVIPNGSLAHGDANTPLTDWDLVVVIPDPDDEYGPGKKNADTLKQRAYQRLRDELSDDFPKLTVIIQGQKRAVLVRYSDPITPGTTDFTGDVICAIDHPSKGLYIPKHNSWDRSHPEEHNRIVRAANAASDNNFSRAVRLLKHWNKRHGDPMCSWHIKVLAAEVINKPTPMADALLGFFNHAADSIEDGPTPDPARVGPDLVPEDAPGTVKRLRVAGDHVRNALDAEAAGRPFLAQHHLADVLPDIVPTPNPKALADEDFLAELKRQKPSVSVGVGAAGTLSVPSNKPWRHD